MEEPNLNQSLGRARQSTRRVWLLAITASATVLGVFLASYRSSPYTPCPLIDGIVSGQSFEELQAAAQFRGTKWTVVDRNALPEGDKRPRYDILTVCTTGYKSLEVSGTLELHFFNGRLSSTRFEPVDISAYLGHLKKMVREAGGDPARVPGSLFQGAKVTSGETYVQWEDPVLAREESEWIFRYA